MRSLKGGRSTVPKLSSEEVAVGLERAATRADLDAAIATFEGACMRGQSDRINRATEAAHAILQAHLDAIAGQITMALRKEGYR
jgi:hypothetical protein